MSIISFEEYLSIDKIFKINKKGKLCKNSINKDTLAKNHININRIEFDYIEREKIFLLVWFSSPDQTIKDQISFQISSTKKPTANWNELEKILSPIIESGHLTNVMSLYKKYFAICVSAYIKDHPTVLSKCGWFDIDQYYYFLSLNYKNGDYTELEKDFFNGLLDSPLFQNTLEDHSERTNSFSDLFDFVKKDACAATVFFYSIHAILWDYLHLYKKFTHEDFINVDTQYFSLCIYGQDSGISKIIANLLCNLFRIKNHKWDIIERKYHCSASSLSERTYDNLRLYKSVPIIFTNRTNQFTKASSIIKRIHTKRERHEFHIFPVYISTSPINADEIINCCSNTLRSNSIIDNVNLLYNIHYQFCLLLYDFIQYLTEISNPAQYSDRTDDHYLHLSIYKQHKTEHLSSQWLDKHFPEYLMYVTASNFCFFLQRNNMGDTAEVLQQISKEIFLQDSVCTNPTMSNTPSIPYHFHFMNFINKYEPNSENNSWIWKGQETREPKETCYYLAAVKGRKEFNLYLKRIQVSPIQTQDFNSMLKEHNLIKLPSSGLSNTLKRNGIYVYIIPVKSLESLSNCT